jgi:hypothetical protein
MGSLRKELSSEDVHYLLCFISMTDFAEIAVRWLWGSMGVRSSLSFGKPDSSLMSSLALYMRDSRLLQPSGT